jgi:Protein of unknown function (Hypoth_ymh)
VDHEWAAERLAEFRDNIDALRDLMDDSELEGEVIDKIHTTYGSATYVVDRLVTLDPVMRELMEAARPGLGDYEEAGNGSFYSLSDSGYWTKTVRSNVLRAIGIHTLGAEAHKRMQPDTPDLVAGQFHSWVWDAAAPLWAAGSPQEAIHTAARSVNARLQQKLSRRNASETALCREAFSPKDAEPGRPRLRFPGDRTSDTWKSRQQGGMDLGAGCGEGIRNPAAHEDGLSLPEQMALEQLAAFSVLARWIDECEVETAPGPSLNLKVGPVWVDGPQL